MLTLFESVLGSPGGSVVLNCLPKTSHIYLLCTCVTIFALTFPKWTTRINWKKYKIAVHCRNLSFCLRTLCTKFNCKWCLQIPSYELNKYLLIGLRKNDLQLVEAMVQLGANLNDPLPASAFPTDDPYLKQQCDYETISGKKLNNDWNFLSVAFMRRLLPLHLAIELKHHRILSYILSLPDVNWNVDTLGGHRPLDLASAAQDREIVELFLCKLKASFNQVEEPSREEKRIRKSEVSKFAQLDVDLCLYLGALASPTGGTLLHAVASTSSLPSNFPSPLEVATILILLGAKVNAVNAAGEAPLHIAVQQPEGELMIRLLLENGANIEATCNLGYTCLHTAIMADCGESMVQRLLGFGLEVDVLSTTKLANSETSQLSPLHLAARRGNVKMVQFLLELGAKPDQLSFLQLTPFDFAAQYGKIEVLEFFLQQQFGPKIFKIRGGSMLCSATFGGQVKMVEYLLKHGVNPTHPNDNGVKLVLTAFTRLSIYYPLLIAAVNGNAEISELLIRHGVNDLDNALQFAVRRDNLSVVKYLVEHGANISGKFGDSCLDSAVLHGNLATSKYLMDKMSSSSMDWSNALSKAIEHNQLKLISFLLAEGAEVNSPIRIPLHTAAAKGQVEVLQMLVEHGADINLQAADTKCTALHFAILNHSLEAAKALLDMGADINIAESAGLKALDVAVSRGKPEFVEILIAAGADVNKAGANAVKPLELAVKTRSYEAAVVLVNAGADIENSKIHESEKVLLRRDVDRLPVYLYSEAWCVVAQSGDVQMAARLVQKGVWYVGDYPLKLAIRLGHIGLVKFILSHDPPPYLRMLSDAIEVDAPIEILEVMKPYVDVNKFQAQNTPLLIAVQLVHVKQVEWLIQNGADVEAINHLAFNALDYAKELPDNDSKVQILKILQAWKKY